MSGSRLVKILNVVFFALMVFVNYLSVVYELGGNSMSELSDRYANLFTPAGISFSIWSVIYIMLLVVLVGQFVGNAPISRNLLFVLSCIFNFSWILAWQYEFVFLSVLVMIALLVTLTRINIQIREEGSEWYKIVFGIYLGWICIATIANVTALLISLELVPSVDVQVFTTIAMITIGLLLVSYVLWRLDNPYLALAAGWAFYGISLKRQDDYPQIALTAQLAMAVIILAAVWLYYKRRVITTRS